MCRDLNKTLFNYCKYFWNLLVLLIPKLIPIEIKMKVNFSTYKILRMVLIAGLIPASAIQGTSLISSVFANNLCLGPLACSAVGGSGGHGGILGTP